ncbi:hypothetical protein AAEU28_17260 [Pseudoalteromonas sp. SS15]|uniref:hypothetical protein n=1 Tax=Pseudoalteromonas sp. SS15 TaxID=3139393 RepID=UPI003BA98AF1
MKYIIIIIFSIFLSACSSTGKTSLSETSNVNKQELFQYDGKEYTYDLKGRLQKVNGKYRFTSYTLVRHSPDYNGIWVNLLTKAPLQEYDSYKCVTSETRARNSSKLSLCPNDYEEYFWKSSFDFAEISYLVEFDSENYMKAFTEAFSHEFRSIDDVHRLLEKISEERTNLNTRRKSLISSLDKLKNISPNGYQLTVEVPNFPENEGKRTVKHHSELHERHALMSQQLSDTEKSLNSEPDKMRAFVYQQQLNDFDRVNSSKTAAFFVNKYKNKRFSDSKIVEKAQKIYKKLLNEEFERDYKNLTSISSYERFASKYSNNRSSLKNLAWLEAAENKIIEHNKQQEELRLASLAKEKAKFISQVNTFREKMNEGDFSHCGLIVERKNKVAKVQTMEGAIFIRIDQLYPKGLAQCHFYNGVYQPPVGLPL